MGTKKNSSKETDPSRVSPDNTTPTGVGPDMKETREQFVERAMADYEAPLIGYAYGFVHDLERARDVVQDTFIRLCRQDIEKVRDGLKSWLFTVCRNRALDIIRKESRLQPLDESYPAHAIDEPSPDDQADTDERIEQLMRYLDRLPENQKTVILMKFRDGLSYREISEATGLTSSNIGFLIHTGIKRLRKILPADLMSGISS